MTTSADEPSTSKGITHNVGMVVSQVPTLPTPRSHATLTPHPCSNALVLFGGESQHGRKVTMYNDLFVYHIDKTCWSKIVSERSPSPRSSHQAAVVDTLGGQLWIFGGETTDKSRVQHHKDLWVFNFTEERWEQVKVPGGPSARSGHRMVSFERHLIVFGGFTDNRRSFTYYNDLHAFSLDEYQWTKLSISHQIPSPRSACQMGVIPTKGVVIYGGYSRKAVGKEEEGVTHSDLFLIQPRDSCNSVVKPARPHSNEVFVIDLDRSATKDTRISSTWTSSLITQTGEVPSPRVGMSWVQTPENRAVAFGGVFDEIQNSECLTGRFYNDVYMLEFDTGHWTADIVRTKKLTRDRKRRLDCGDDSNMETDSSANDDTEQLSKRLRLSTQLQSHPRNNTAFQQPQILTFTEGTDMDIDIYAPPPRMHPCLAIKNDTLFVFGGVLEKGDKIFTLGDMYSLNLHKLESWDVIYPGNTPETRSDSKQSKSGNNSSSDESDSKSDSENESDTSDNKSESESETNCDMADAMKPLPDEAITPYMKRTKDIWLSKAQKSVSSENRRLSAKNLHKMAKDLAADFYKSQGLQ